MFAHPVQLHVARAERVPRIHVAIRLVLVVALGLVAWSSIYWLLYLALPAMVALDLLQKGSEAFITRDAPRVVRGLRWLAGAEAYLFFLSNELPSSTGGAIDLNVNLSASPTASGLSAVSSLVWILAAIVALVTERIPRLFGDFFVVVLRLKYRLLAYHLSLVDRYPSLVEQGLDRPLTT
jgi:hypothetical protein